MAVNDVLKDVTVVIPTLNEAEAIGRVLKEVLSIGIPERNVLVIDGGSTDGTKDIASSYGVKVIIQDGKGKADALRTALRYVRTPYMLVMDGDYTYPAIHILDSIRIAGRGYDLVIGVRKARPGSQELIFRLGNALLTKAFNTLFGVRLSDVLSGMYLIRTERLREVMFEMRGFSVESEIVAHVASTSGLVAEVPISYRRRLGVKKLGIKHGLQIGKDMIRLAWRYNPTFFIFLLGSILLIPGLIIGGWAAYDYLFLGVKHYVKGLIAIITCLAGFQSLLMAILSLYMKRLEMRFNRRMDTLTRTIKLCRGEEVIEENPQPNIYLPSKTLTQESVSNISNISPGKNTKPDISEV